MKIVIITAVIVLTYIIWWRVFRIARPEVPPLIIDPDDPLMKSAIAQAQSTLGRFQELAGKPNQGARVKIPFVTSSGEKEFLWSELLALREFDMDVRYLTPPITHTGRLERLHTHPISDLVDWQIELNSGQYEGGYTMKVMFIRGREQWGQLPPELANEEKKYA